MFVVMMEQEIIIVHNIIDSIYAFKSLRMLYFKLDQLEALCW